MSDSEDENIFNAKVVLLGSAGVGKTCLVISYKTGNFPTNATPTIGASYMAKKVSVNDNQKIKMQMWDTAGQERFASMASLYYRNADAAVLVFDITDRKTLLSVKAWVKELQDHIDVPEDIVLALAANKCDLPMANSNESKALFNEAKLYANNIGAKLYKTSAKTSLNIDAIFDDVANLIYKNKLNNGTLNDYGIQALHDTNIIPDPKKKIKCC